MNTSTPKPLARSREFLALDFGGRLAVRVLWRRGASRRWEDDELLSADDQVTLELEASGLFDGPGAVEVRAQMLRAMLRTGALVREPGALEMPIFTGDRPRDERSETPEARRKREQRDRDRKDPARIEERRRQREARAGEPVGEPPSPSSAARDTARDTSPLSRPPVTLDVTVTEPVTSSVSEEVGGGRGSSSSSSSSSSPEQRDQGVPTRASAEGAAPPVTEGVTPSGGGSVTGDVTPSGARLVTAAEVVQVFKRVAPTRVGTAGNDRLLARVEERFRELAVTHEELDRMAQLAARRELLGQDRRAVTDLGLLASQRDDEGKLLASWVSATRASLAQDRIEAERKRAPAQQPHASTQASPPSRNGSPPGAIATQLAREIAAAQKAPPRPAVSLRAGYKGGPSAASEGPGPMRVEGEDTEGRDVG